VKDKILAVSHNWLVIRGRYSAYLALVWARIRYDNDPSFEGFTLLEVLSVR
jgi:hypothetical protein